METDELVTTKPFASRSQWKQCFAMDDPRWDCHKWAHETPGGAVKRFRKLPIKKKSSEHTGAIIGVWLPEDVAQRVHGIAVDALGEKIAVPAEDLHITIEYLGKVEDLGEMAQDLMLVFLNFGKDIVSNLEGQPIKGTIGGVGRFFTDDPDGTPIYLSVDSRDLTQARGLLDEELEELEIEPPSDHGFTAHITIGYIPKEKATPTFSFDPIPVSFDTLYLALGGARIPFPLTQFAQKSFIEDESIEVKALVRFLTQKGEKLAPGITRISGDRCNVHGRWGSCSAAGFGGPEDVAKDAKQKGPGVKPIQYGNPKKGGGGKGGGGKGGKGGKDGKGGVEETKLTPEEKRDLQKAQNLSDVMTQLNIPKEGVDVLQSLAQGDRNISREDLAKGGFVEAGLVEMAADGTPRLTTSGRQLLTAGQQGDLGKAGDIIAQSRERLAESIKRNQERAAKKRPDIAGGFEEKPKSGGGKGGGGGGSKDKPKDKPKSSTTSAPSSNQPAGTGYATGNTTTPSPGSGGRVVSPSGPVPGPVYQPGRDQPPSTGTAPIPRSPNPGPMKPGNPNTGPMKPGGPGTIPPSNRIPNTGPRKPLPGRVAVPRPRRRGTPGPTRGKEVWSTAFVNNLPDSAFLFIETSGKKDETGRTTPRGLRHLPYKGTDGKIDLAHLRNAIARIPQMNDLPGLDKEGLQKKARSILENGNKDKTIEFLRRGATEKTKVRPGSDGLIAEGSVRGKSSLFIFKDSSGADRWVIYTSNPYRDRDGEYVTAKALKEDVDNWWAEGCPPTPLRWWHFGKPYFERPGDWTTVQPGPGADLGTCDFRALHGHVLVESGTFKSAKIGRVMARHAKELEASLGFAHPPTEPDDGGGFLNIKSFERSLTPARKASNLFTAFLTHSTKERKNMDADKLEALRRLGVNTDEVIEGAEHIQRKARSRGTPMRLKSADDDEEYVEADEDDVSSKLDALTQQLAALQSQMSATTAEAEPEERFEDLMVSELTVGELQGVLNSVVTTKSVEPVGQALQVVFEELQEIKDLLTHKSVQSVVEQVAKMRSQIERLSARTKGIGGKVRELEEGAPRILSRGVRPAEAEETVFNLEDDPEIAQKSAQNGSPFSWLDTFVNT